MHTCQWLCPPAFFLQHHPREMSFINKIPKECQVFLTAFQYYLTQEVTPKCIKISIKIVWSTSKTRVKLLITPYSPLRIASSEFGKLSVTLGPDPKILPTELVLGKPVWMKVKPYQLFKADYNSATGQHSYALRCRQRIQLTVTFILFWRAICLAWYWKMNRDKQNSIENWDDEVTRSSNSIEIDQSGYHHASCRSSTTHLTVEYYLCIQICPIHSVNLKQRKNVKQI